MSTVTLQSQGVPHWVPQFLNVSRATHFKGVGNYPTYSNVVTIGRPYYDQSKVDQRVAEGAIGADRMFDAVRGEIEKNPQVHIWETPANEASIWKTEVANGYVAFNQRMIQRFHDMSKKVIVGAINTGWPKLPHEDGGVMMRMIVEASLGADGLSFHEYGRWDMRDGYNEETGLGYECLRYRRFHDYVNGDHPPIYITETGLDRTDPPGPDNGHSGWKITLDDNEQAYIDMLLWYEQELQKDEYVKCATIFVTEHSFGWDSFEVYEGIAMKLANQLAALEPPEPTPEPPPIGGDVIVKVYDSQGNERSKEWLNATYGPVEVSATANADYGTVVLREVVNTHMALVVSVRDSDGNPIPNVEARFSWPDGTVTGETNDEGDIGFGMGPESYYYPPQKGPHWIDCGGVHVDGLGWLGSTNHDHLNVELYEGEPEPTPSSSTPPAPSPSSPPEPSPSPPESAYPDYVKFFDRNGIERDEEWVVTYFGPGFFHVPDESRRWKVIRMDEGYGDSHLLTITAVTKDGYPIQGVKFVVGQLYDNNRYEVFTNAEGEAYLFMDDDSFLYSVPAQKVPYCTAVTTEREHSDIVGVGVVRSVDRWLNVTVEMPYDEPDDCTCCEEVIGLMILIIEKLDILAEKYDNLT